MNCPHSFLLHDVACSCFSLSAIEGLSASCHVDTDDMFAHTSTKDGNEDIFCHKLTEAELQNMGPRALKDLLSAPPFNVTDLSSFIDKSELVSEVLRLQRLQQAAGNPAAEDCQWFFQWSHQLGVNHGPYSSSIMAEWRRQGFFDADPALKVARCYANRNIGPYIPLSSVSF